MCRPEDFEHLMAPEPRPEPAPLLRRESDRRILDAVRALGLPDCPPDCSCRGRAPEEVIARP